MRRVEGAATAACVHVARAHVDCVHAGRQLGSGVAEAEASCLGSGAFSSCALQVLWTLGKEMEEGLPVERVATWCVGAVHRLRFCLHVFPHAVALHGNF